MSLSEITVITPVYNGRAYIEACLQNVVNQNCSHVEHLIMDGGSNDGTVELIVDWAKKYPHIRLISEKDKGQSDAMNKGIAQAKGKIISFLNVDDCYETNVLNRALEIFKDLPEPAFVCGNLNIWNADGSLKHFNRPNRIGLTELISDCFEWPYNPSAYFYHKSLHEKTGPYNLENHFCMDYEFILEAARFTQIQHVDENWGNFAMVEGSKTLVNHTHNFQQAAKYGEELRMQAFNKLSVESQAEVEQIRKSQIKPVVAKRSLLDRTKSKLKQLLRS